MKPFVIVWLLLSLCSTSVWAQAPPVPAQPPPQPPVLDATTIYAHLLYLEDRVKDLSAQVKDASTADLASQHQIGLQIEAVHELIVVEAGKPNALVAMLTNRTFWELAAGLAGTIIIAIQKKSK